MVELTFVQDYPPGLTHVSPNTWDIYQDEYNRYWAYDKAENMVAGLNELDEMKDYLDTLVLTGIIKSDPALDMTLHFYLEKTISLVEGPVTLYHVYEAKVGVQTKRFDNWRYQDALDWIGDKVGPQGHIFDVYYWYSGPHWREMWPIDEYVPPPMGTDIYFNPRWHNDGGVTFTGHMNLEVTSPSGVKYYPSAYSGQDTTVAPDDYGYPRFNPVLLNESGTWTLKATLIYDGITLDEVTTSFSVIKALPSSANVKVKGKATGGYPIPDMRLYIYDNDMLIDYKDFSISIGSWYTFEKVITGAGLHKIYGVMVLTNKLGSFEFFTSITEIEFS